MQAFGASIKGKDHIENEDAFLIDTEKNLFAVADGVSIPKGGKIAAKLAVSFLSKYFHGNLKESFELVNRRIFEMRIKKLCGFTTLTAVYIKNNRAVICNVGDSPAFIIRKGEIKQLAILDKAFANVLNQAIGEGNVNVHENEISLEKNDIILLVTDGISDVVSLDEILKITESYKTAKEICKAILRLAEQKEQVYNDDKTIVVIRF